MSTKSNIEKYKEELEELIKKGALLTLNLCAEFVNDEQKAEIPKDNLLDFREHYESWYTISMRVVKQVLPDRLSDFKSQYKDEKRKELNYLTYCISDYMLGISVPAGFKNSVDGRAAINKLAIQTGILNAARDRLESSIYDMRELLQADLFDNELDAATELAKNGFLRGAGAIAGVVLESHLGDVCSKHGIPVKKNPTIYVFNELLKGENVIDTSDWKFIAYLGDLRNLCDHKRDREPTNNLVSELIFGVAKIIKTVS